jgi:hypothetical protein
MKEIPGLDTSKHSRENQFRNRKGVPGATTTEGIPFISKDFHLQELAEILDSQACALNNYSHGDRVNRVMSRDSDDVGTIGHDDVFALSFNPEACFLQSSNHIQMINARKSGHNYSHSAPKNSRVFCSFW